MDDTEWFESMYDQYYDDVAKFVWRRAPDVEVADVVQTVFLTAWRRGADVPREAPLPWLFGVARHTLANEIRSRRRGRQRDDRVRALHPPERSDDYSDQVINRVMLRAAFDSLTPRDQEILRLIAWEGLSVSEAATVLGSSRTAVAMRILRLRKRLESLPRPAAGSPATASEFRLLREAIEGREP